MLREVPVNKECFHVLRNQYSLRYPIAYVETEGTYRH